MSWRPDEKVWQEAIDKAVKERFEQEGSTDWIFYVEAGADAMLHEALKGVVDWLTLGEYKASGLMLPAGWRVELYRYFGLTIPDDEKEQG